MTVFSNVTKFKIEGKRTRCSPIEASRTSNVRELICRFHKHWCRISRKFYGSTNQVKHQTQTQIYQNITRFASSVHKTWAARTRHIFELQEIWKTANNTIWNFNAHTHVLGKLALEKPLLMPLDVQNKST